MMSRPMIPFDQALALVLETIPRLEDEQVSLDDCLGRILARDVISDMDMPPFDKSAMDGFACRREDLGSPLEIIETIPAGHSPRKALEPGQAARIMTGAMLPKGADTVFMVEYSRMLGDTRVEFCGSHTRANICRQGEDIREGDLLISRGRLITPADVAVLASAGCHSPLVKARPKVMIIATGDELVEPDRKPGPSEIRNSNSHQLLAQARRAGADARYLGIARDNLDDLSRLLAEAMKTPGIILLSGGVSMGDFDLVPEAMRLAGLETVFDSVAVKPGKPTTFARGRDHLCFGLPGNPVSTFVIFELLVRTLLDRMSGRAREESLLEAVLGQELSRRSGERDEWLPVTLGPDRVCNLVRYHGSAHFLALSQATGLLRIPAGVTELKQGARVSVRPLQS